MSAVYERILLSKERNSVGNIALSFRVLLSRRHREPDVELSDGKYVSIGKLGTDGLRRGFLSR